MPRFISGGRILAGPPAGAGVVSIDGVPLIDHGTSFCELNAHEVIGQALWQDRWQVVAIDPATRVVRTVEPAGIAKGASVVAAGGDLWAAFLADGVSGVRDSLGRTWPRAAIGDVNDRGDLVLIDDYQQGTALRILAPDDPADGGRLLATAPVGPAMCLRGEFLLYTAAGRLQAIGAPTPASLPVPPSSGARFCSSGAGNFYLVHNDHDRLVLYPWRTTGPVRGYVLSTDGHDLRPDIASMRPGHLIVATATNQGETPDSIRRYDVDLLNKSFQLNGGAWWPLLEIDLETAPAPSAPAIASFHRRVQVGCFKVTLPSVSHEAPGDFEILTDGVPFAQCANRVRPLIVDLQSWESVPDWKVESGEVAALFAVIGRDDLRAAAVLADARDVPVIWYDDGAPGDVFFRLDDLGEFLLPRDRCMVKAYPISSSVDRDVSRIADVVHAIATAGHRVALAWPSYTQQGRWPLTQVLAMQTALADLVRATPAIDLLGCFSWGRASGCLDHPVLAECVRRLIAAGAHDASTPVTPPQPPSPPLVPPAPPAPPTPTVHPPEDEEPIMKLPALAYALLHNSNIATLAPGQTAVELAHTPQEYGGYQQVEVRKSKEWTPENPRVLVRFTDANRLFRVNKVLAQQRKYDACVETYDPAAPDADSSWQQGLAAGPFVHFTGDSEDGSRHGVVYTLTIVDQAGMLFL